MRFFAIFLFLISNSGFGEILEVPKNLLDSYRVDCPVSEINTDAYGGPSHRKYRERCTRKELVWFDGYVSHVINTNRLVEMAKKYPSRARLIDFGQTVRGKKMLALKVTDLSFEDESRKTPVLLNCAHHASELMSIEFCYQILHELLHTSSDVISKYVFLIVPLVNPDGSENYWHRTAASGRKNGRRTMDGEWTGKDGVDLNRNYPFRWGQLSNTTSDGPSSSYYMGPEAASEPEIQAMMNLANEMRFTLSLSFHTAATKILTPYTIPGAVNPLPDVPRAFADIVAKKARTAREGRPYEVVKNLYPVSGTDQDWHYNANGTIALLVEGPFSHWRADYAKSRQVSRGFLPGFYHYLRHYEVSPKLRVFVKDQKGRPVVARVSLKQFDFYEGERWHTDPRFGRYVFVLKEQGEYEIEVEWKDSVVRRKVDVNSELLEITVQVP